MSGVKRRFRVCRRRPRWLMAGALLVAGFCHPPASASEIPSDDVLPAAVLSFIGQALPRSAWEPGGQASQQQREMTAFFEGTLPAQPAVPLFGRGRRNHDIWFAPLPLRNVFFAGYDVSGADHFASIGLKRALGSTLDEPGFRLLGSLGVKIAARDSTTGDRATRLHALRIGLGREFRFGDISITPYAGAGFVANPDGAVLAGAPRGRFGPVAMLDLWHNWPAAPLNSRYSSAFVMLDQPGRSVYIRVRHGFGTETHPWRIGPEASFSTGATLRSKGTRLQDGWNRKRLGLHVSEIPLGEGRLSLSGGYEWREHGKSALYAQAGVYFRY